MPVNPSAGHRKISNTPPSSKTVISTRLFDGFPITVTDPGALPGVAAGGRRSARARVRGRKRCKSNLGAHVCISGPTTRQTLRRYVAYVKYVKYVRSGRRGCMGEGGGQPHSRYS